MNTVQKYSMPATGSGSATLLQPACRAAESDPFHVFCGSRFLGRFWESVKHPLFHAQVVVFWPATGC